MQNNAAEHYKWTVESKICSLAQMICHLPDSQLFKLCNQFIYFSLFHFIQLCFCLIFLDCTPPLHSSVLKKLVKFKSLSPALAKKKKEMAYLTN